jgi:hypothetical protein
VPLKTRGIIKKFFDILNIEQNPEKNNFWIYAV